MFPQKPKQKSQFLHLSISDKDPNPLTKKEYLRLPSLSCLHDETNDLLTSSACMTTCWAYYVIYEVKQSSTLGVMTIESYTCSILPHKC